ncbi:MAG: hypothetical protein SGPRY_000795 [Prymnesium sp.]
MLAASMLLLSFMPHAPLRRAAPRLERQRQVSLDASRTERIFRTLPGESQTGGAGGQSTYDALLALERRWAAMKAGNTPPVPELVRDTHADRHSGLDAMDFDVVVAGGNIGVLLATALALRGLRVAIVEAGKLRGREQDWNASRKEVEELVALGVISEEELARVIGIERIGVVLAQVFEGERLQRVDVHSDGVLLQTGSTQVSAKLLLDCMGQGSPIVAQVLTCEQEKQEHA